jgi:hypothetical protein
LIIIGVAPGALPPMRSAQIERPSSASPVVVGAAASAQGVALANGRRLTSIQMRGLLRNNGTAQAASSQQIGPLPDLRKALPKVIAGQY